MKITFIRHAKVRFEWSAVCDSETFDRCCAEYDAAPVEPGVAIACGAGIVYTSELRRTADTVQHQLGNRPVVKTPALNEIPLVSFMDSRLPLPTLAWMLMGRLQWYCNRPRQPESRQQSHTRIDDFLDHLQHQGEDCVLVGHGMYFAQLLSALKRRGAVGNMKKRIKNSEAREFFL